ncbi:hypothetical protein B0H65DRAFT_553428 [Neurospora tetraspora]|uniref:Uncharacterized protein n=1 Tax=Neurospora tetraspora TaxID=94610 RepID=A0AAE0J0V4_9PEZI|nr:hypothetical protein B0H65DRAFT_553428 [Neurospora tetraspora]
MELVREVLDHFIEDMLAPCHPGIEAFQSVTSKSTIDTSTDRLCEIGGPLRGEPLLKSQKRLIERHMHFTKNYLSQTTIYLFLDDPSSDYMDQYRMKDYCRYLRFPESTFNDIDMDPSTTIPLQGLKKATFFLHGPILEASDVDYDHDEHGFDPQTVSDMEVPSAVPFAWDWRMEREFALGGWIW